MVQPYIATFLILFGVEAEKIDTPSVDTTAEAGAREHCNAL